MAISFNHIPAGIRVPLFYAEFDASQAGAFAQDQRTLLIGQMLAAGSAAAGAPVLVTRTDQALGLFGQGSMLHRMVAACRRNDGFGEVWCLPLADHAAATAATGTLALTGPATAAGTLALYIAGQRVQQAVAAGATAAAIATALAATINAAAGLPVTAAADAGTVTLTARHKGALGNAIDLRLDYRGELGGESTPAGLGVAITAMAGGATDPDLAAALAGLGDGEYDFVACPYTDTANLDVIAAEWGEVTGRWSYARQVYGHVFAARAGTVAALSTFGTARNDPHVTVAGLYASPTPPWELAAALTAVAAASLRIDPARPLQTLPLAGVLAPAPADRFTLAERQILLFDGIATLRIAEDGTVQVERLITTYQRNAWGVADPSYLDVTTLCTLVAVTRRMKAAIARKFGRHKLANDGTRFGAGQAIVTPRIVRAELIAQYGQMEALGLVENAAAFAAHLIVERNADDPNRLDVLYPPDLVNQLRIFAVLTQFRLQYPA